MEFFGFYFVFAIVVGVVASSRGRSGFLWFLLAILISPLLSIILVLALNNKAHEKLAEIQNQNLISTHVKCPDCAELVKKEARVCKHCSCKLIPQ